MRHHQRSKLELARYHIAQALSHFDEKVDLLYQTFFLTIHVKKKCQIRKIQKPIFFTICDVLKTKASNIIGSRQPGLILAGDIEKSRYGVEIKTLTNPVYPHIHGLLFIPKDVMDKFTHDEIERYVEAAIGEIVEVKQSDKSVKCEQYRPTNSIVEVATYIEKAAYMANHWNIHEYDTMVLPTALSAGKNIYGAKKQAMAAQYDFIYDMLTVNPGLTEIDLRKNVSTETPELHPMDDPRISELARKIRRSEVAIQI